METGVLVINSLSVGIVSYIFITDNCKLTPFTAKQQQGTSSSCNHALV